MSRYWPSKRQWKQWTLPSKATYASFPFAFLSIVIAAWLWFSDSSTKIINTLAKHEQTLQDIKNLLAPVKDSKYRELVAAVIHSFDPKAVIKVGSGVDGPDGTRSVDIAIRSLGNGKPLFIALEVVDLPEGRKAGVEIVDALDSKRNDLGADIALICSNTGFDGTAIRKAKRIGIGLISVLSRGDERVKVFIEEEIYLRRVNLQPVHTTVWGVNLPAGLKIQPHELQYHGKSVDAWLQDQVMITVTRNPLLSGPTTLRFDLKSPTQFKLRNLDLTLHAMSITFHPRIQWLAQTVRLDASGGIYDYIRGRVSLSPGQNSYTIEGVNFYAGTPIEKPPPRQAFGFGLLPGEIDMQFVTIDGFSRPKELESAKLDELIRERNLISHESKPPVQ